MAPPPVTTVTRPGAIRSSVVIASLSPTVTEIARRRTGPGTRGSVTQSWSRTSRRRAEGSWRLVISTLVISSLRMNLSYQHSYGDTVTKFNEVSAAEGWLGRFPGREILPILTSLIQSN